MGYPNKKKDAKSNDGNVATQHIGEWGEPYPPEILERIEKAIAKGLITWKDRGPCPPFEPLEIPGVSLSEEIIKDRSEW